MHTLCTYTTGYTILPGNPWENTEVAAVRMVPGEFCARAYVNPCVIWRCAPTGSTGFKTYMFLNINTVFLILKQGNPRSHYDDQNSDHSSDSDCSHFCVSLTPTLCIPFSASASPSFLGACLLLLILLVRVCTWESPEAAGFSLWSLNGQIFPGLENSVPGMYLAFGFSPGWDCLGIPVVLRRRCPWSCFVRGWH